MNADQCKIAVIGAGLVGERHARLVSDNPRCQLAAIVDPRPEVSAVGQKLGCPVVSDLAKLDAAVDAAIIATPNHTHATIALECARLEVACLIEKPLTDDVLDGHKVIDAFDKAALPLLVGHHRRYHPFVRSTKELLESGDIGVPVVGSVIWAVRKPDSYYAKGAWRLGADGGPVMINLIHEVDLMRCLFGEVALVNAVTSSAQRGGSVEDTAAVILRFESGFLATVALSDTALTPWSFEGATAENPNIAHTGTSSWRVGCTKGAFEFPRLRVWKSAQGQGDWSKPLMDYPIETEKIAPLAAQLDHFVDLVLGKTNVALVSGMDGLKSLELTRAVLHAADTSSNVNLVQ